MKHYRTPEVDVVDFRERDVITASGEISVTSPEPGPRPPATETSPEPTASWS